MNRWVEIVAVGTANMGGDAHATNTGKMPVPQCPCYIGPPTRVRGLSGEVGGIWPIRLRSGQALDGG